MAAAVLALLILCLWGCAPSGPEVRNQHPHMVATIDRITSPVRVVSGDLELTTLPGKGADRTAIEDLRMERLDELSDEDLQTAAHLGGVAAFAPHTDLYGWYDDEKGQCMFDGNTVSCTEDLFDMVGTLWTSSIPGMYRVRVGVPDGGAEVLIATDEQKTISVLPHSRGLAIADWPTEFGHPESVTIVDADGNQLFFEELQVSLPG